MPISQGKVTLGATQPVRLAGGISARSFIVKASETNAEAVYVGPSGVSSSTGFPLVAGESVSVEGGGLDDLYVVGTSGDSVVFMAVA